MNFILTGEQGDQGDTGMQGAQGDYLNSMWYFIVY